MALGIVRRSSVRYLPLKGLSPHVPLSEGIMATTSRRPAGWPHENALRNNRIELRTTREEKQLLAVAASFERLDVTTFVLRSALPAARAAARQASRVTLSRRDSAAVLELLENPPEPGPRLLRAVAAAQARTPLSPGKKKAAKQR